MKITIRVLLIFNCWVLFFTGCRRDEYADIAVDSKIVIEGWIEQGGVARVIVSESVPMTARVDSSNYLKYVVRSATVTVSDGEKEEMLRLKSNNHHIPPYVYTGENIIGQTGGTYTLTVRCRGCELTAKTTIPASVPIKEVDYIKKNETDTIGHLNVSFTDPANHTNYYQVATLVEGLDEIFIPALYGNLSDKDFAASDVALKITRGISIYPETNFQSYFNDGDKVRVKLRTMNKEGYDFWNSWQNEIMNAQNPIFPANSSLKSNIKGGIGIWCGYGQDTRIIQLPVSF